MNEIKQALDAGFPAGVYKIVLSVPRGAEDKKLTITKKDGGFQAEHLRGAQAFHQNLTGDEVKFFVLHALDGRFRQYQAWDGQFLYEIKVTKKGRVLTRRAVCKQPPKAENSHNRQKNYILQAGQAASPLVDMGILTNSGQVVSAMYGKFKQINRFVEMVDDEVGNLHKKRLSVIDFGCGKSYLTFVLYHYLTEIRGFEVSMVGLDLKEAVINNCNAAAQKYGYHGLRFEQGDIRGYRPDGPVDMVVTLHACDTATDYALYHAVKWGAELIFSVPCCQHELNAQINSGELSLLTRYGIVKERASALMTDAIRGNLLQYCGYRTQLLEFIEMEHTPKNILIRANRAQVGKQQREAALAEVERLCGAFSLRPTLYRLLLEKDGGGRLSCRRPI